MCCSANKCHMSYTDLMIPKAKASVNNLSAAIQLVCSTGKILFFL